MMQGCSRHGFTSCCPQDPKNKELRLARAVVGSSRLVLSRIMQDGMVENHGHRPDPGTRQSGCVECQEYNDALSALAAYDAVAE